MRVCFEERVADMRRRQNVIIFSAGESVRNGKVEYIKDKLEKNNIICMDWRDLFSSAHHSEQIALLPALSKKIPTFDFALVVAEGVDEVRLRGESEIKAMRDNVVFELGLCVMALGADRVILLAEDCVHIPDDLIGIGKIGVEHIAYSSDYLDESLTLVEETIQNKLKRYEAQLDLQLGSVIKHITFNADTVSPVFIGAAVSSAEAYYMNFIVRLLENTGKGFRRKGRHGVTYSFPDSFSIKIIFPVSVNSFTRSAISKYYSDNKIQEFEIENAGTRGLFFNGYYNEDENELTVIDIPTSVTASYSVVNSILNIASDDDYDLSAEERFVTKEMDVYEYSLKKLFTAEVAEKRLAFIDDADKRAKIIERLQRIEIVNLDIEAC